MKQIDDCVVVITGASSGIGKATALELADKGAKLVLAARRGEALAMTAQECEKRGAQAITVPTDVTNEGEVKALARRAVEAFGRIDVWVNNAAVSLFAKFGEAPMDVYRKVIETNLFGYLYGAEAALRQFKEQGAGTLINVDSVVAKAPQPFTSAYVISKSGVRVLGEALRMELNLDGLSENIKVCTVMPATMDTPLFQHAANYTGQAANAMPPVYAPEKVARAIMKLIKAPQRELVVGTAGRLMALERLVNPWGYERRYARQVEKTHLQKNPAEPTAGNVLEPMHEYTDVRGGWTTRRAVAKSRLGMLKWAGPAAVVVAAGVASWLLREQLKVRKPQGWQRLKPLAGATHWR